MGVSWSGASFEDLSEKLKIMVQALPFAAEEAVENLTESAEEQMHGLLAVRRKVETGALRDSIGSTVERNEDTVRGEVGMINDTPATGSGEREGYAYPQEYGFHHYKSNQWVEGMFLLRDTAIFISQQAGNELYSSVKEEFTWRG